jgi:hypothetical protein
LNGKMPTGIGCITPHPPTTPHTHGLRTEQSYVGVSICCLGFEMLSHEI